MLRRIFCCPGFSHRHLHGVVTRDIQGVDVPDTAFFSHFKLGTGCFNDLFVL